MAEGLEALQVWQKALNLSLKVQQEILPLFPQEEKWVMATQLRRASQSIPANIAEGYGRYYYQETVRFCYIARGSLEETYTFLTMAYRLGYLHIDIYQSAHNQIIELRRLINGYISYLKKNKRGENDAGSLYSIQDDPRLYSVSDASEYPISHPDITDTSKRNDP